MSPSCTVPGPVIHLHTPWWRRLLAAVPGRSRRRTLPESARPQTWRSRDLWTLRHLSAQTLRDIGAPEWVHEQESRSRTTALDLLRL